ncbi:MAG: HAD-IA family hydrolase [Gammaproteobacteria bacterium]|nr:HAD-IA family hydrolase [Gammaproteobacteria bacterium]
MSKSCELVVFDWDGTLMDSEAAIITCMGAAIAALGLEPSSEHSIRGIIGLGLNEAVRQLYPTSQPVVHGALVESYRRHFMALEDTSQALFPGVIETLEAIAAEGIDMAVATGKSRRGLDKVLADTQLNHYFVATRTADECHSKPHPQMLLEVMELSGAAPGQTLMVGDSVHDVGMAKNAGVAVLGVSYGVQSSATLLAEGAIACVDQIDSVMDYIGLQDNRTGSG